jgi:hypothetical protein
MFDLDARVAKKVISAKVGCAIHWALQIINHTSEIANGFLF